MEISTSNIAKGTLTSGIVPLSIDEIEMVSGGKSAIATWWEGVLAFFSGGGSAPTAPPGGVRITGAELTQMQHDCVAAGGNFSATATTQYGGGTFIFTNGSGE